MLKIFSRWLFIILAIGLHIKAAEDLIPTLEEWSRQYQQQTPFCDMH